MKKIRITLSVFVVSCQLSTSPIAQESGLKTDFGESIMQVLEGKHHVENKANKKVSEEVKKELYLTAVRKIKATPEYLSYIDKNIAVHKKELSEKWLDYKYVSPLSSVHLKSNMVTHWQYLKVVRYSLFEAKADTLLSLDKVPFMREAYLKEVALEQKRSAETMEYLRKRSILKP